MGLAAAATAGVLSKGCSEPAPPPPPVYSPFAGEPKSDRPNIVLYISDTLRADHLSCYGRTPQTSPVVDSLAQDGVLFEHCISGSTWTKPSIGTMFTGLPARVHQAVAAEGNIKEVIQMEAYRVQVLREEFQTLPETFKKLGYSTAYFMGNAHGRPEFGYGRGFDHVIFNFVYHPGVQVEDAIRWIWESSTEPFFIIIHQIDPHGPYTPEEHYFYDLHGTTKAEASQIMDPDQAERVQLFVDEYDTVQARGAVKTVTPEANEYLKMLYDAEIYAVDSTLKRLINHFKRIGIYDNTVFAFTSDHGEGFREHNFYGHGVLAELPYHELIHVPLVMAGGGLPKNVRVSQTTSMIDLYPTLIELAGGSSPEYVTGSPMISRNGEVLVDQNRLGYTDYDYYRADLGVWVTSVFDGRYKIAVDKAKNKQWIFDFESDPGELKNLYGSLPVETERSLLAQLNEQVERYDKLRQQFGEPVWMEAEDGVHEELQALGYL